MLQSRVPVSTCAEVNAFERGLRNVYGTFDAIPFTVAASGNVRAIDCPALPGIEVWAKDVRSRRPALDGQWSDAAFVVLVLSGSIDVDHYDRVSRLTAGDMALLDAQEPCQIDVPHSAHAVTLRLCRTDLLALRTCAEAVFSADISGRRPISRILATTLVSAIREKCHDDTENRAIRSAVYTLLDQSLDSERSYRGLSESERLKLQAMQSWVLNKPDAVGKLVEAMAGEFGMSRRTLYRFFERLGTSPTRWVTNVRLGSAYRRLAMADGRETITAIAYSCGFSDSGQFARLFKRKFGALPSECRTKPERQTALKPPGR